MFERPAVLLKLVKEAIDVRERVCQLSNTEAVSEMFVNFFGRVMAQNDKIIASDPRYASGLHSVMLKVQTAVKTSINLGKQIPKTQDEAEYIQKSIRLGYEGAFQEFIALGNIVLPE